MGEELIIVRVLFVITGGEDVVQIEIDDVTLWNEELDLVVSVLG